MPLSEWQQQLASVKFTDARSETRFHYAGRATLSLADGRRSYSGEIVNLSNTGCLIRIPEAPPIEVDAILELNLQSSFLGLRARGVLRHTREGGKTLGIAFLNLSAQSRIDLLQLILQLEAASDVPRPVLVF
jgi:hypothetical protein